MDNAKIEKMEELLERPDVQEKLAEMEKNKELTSAVILDFWKEQGVELTEEELKEFATEISDDDLDEVVGGLNTVQRKVKKVGTEELLNADVALNADAALNAVTGRMQLKNLVNIYRPGSVKRARH